MRLRDAALAYAERGWAVFPCKPGEKVPDTAHGCKDATTDRTQIEDWWTDKPDRNIGVATGSRSGIWVVDVDGDEGLDAFVALGHGLPGTLTAHTPSGGLHFVFLDPGGLGNTARSLTDGVDTRGDGGYIVVAPSVHPNGGRYRWGGRQKPSTAPGWLLRLARKPPAEPTPVRVDTKVDAEGYVQAAVQAECETVASAPVGTRNDTLNRASFNLGTLVGAGMLSGADAHGALMQAASACGLPDREARRTISSGLSAGTEHPREVAS